MNRDTYNLIIKLISFAFAVAFIVGKIVGFISFSWWGIMFPILLEIIFHDNGDDGGNMIA